MNSWDLDKIDNKREYRSSKDEKWEKSSQAAIWIVLSIVITCGLIFFIKLNVEEILLKFGGNSIETEFKNGTTLDGVNKDGNQVTVSFKNGPTVSTRKLTDDSGNYYEITKEYRDDGMTAFKDKNNIIHIVPLNFTMLSLRNYQSITVYYYGDDMENAKALNSIWFWVVLYCVLIPLLFLCVFASYRIMNPKSHVSLNVLNENQ